MSSLLAGTAPQGHAERPRLRPTLRVLALLAGIAAAAGPSLWARLIVEPAAERLIGTIRHHPSLIEAVGEQNERLGGESEAEIAALDALWRAEKIRGGGPVLAAMLEREPSRFLAALIREAPAIRLAILMDAHGRTVAVSSTTTDYFQGDEPKWLETFGKPTGHRHVSPIEAGHDGRFRACWVSEPLNDPATGAPLGAFAVEVDAERTRGALCRP